MTKEKNDLVKEKEGKLNQLKSDLAKEWSKSKAGGKEGARDYNKISSIHKQRGQLKNEVKELYKEKENINQKEGK